MAKHRGRGVSTIEYPTGMNQNGDPSQAWIKLKPDGRVDVFAGTVDIGQGSKTVHTQIVADAIGVPYDWVTMDNSNTDSSPVCTGTFASRGTFIGGNAVRFAAERVRERILDIASRLLESGRVRPRDRRRRGVGEGRAGQEGVGLRRCRRRDVGLRRAHHRYRRGLEAVRRGRPGERRRRARAALRDLLRRLRRRRRGGRRDRRGDRPQAAPGLRRRPGHQPHPRGGPDRGRRDDGPRPRRARGVLSVLPGRRAPRRLSSARTWRRACRTCPTSSR